MYRRRVAVKRRLKLIVFLNAVDIEVAEGKERDIICASPAEDTLPVGTPFHERTLALCESLNYREWSGYYTVSVYEMHHEHEYNAIRNSAALIDISPLFKYRVTGRDATKLVNRVISRDINKVAVDQVIYCCWCDPEGKVI